MQLASKRCHLLACNRVSERFLCPPSSPESDNDDDDDDNDNKRRRHSETIRLHCSSQSGADISSGAHFKLNYPPQLPLKLNGLPSGARGASDASVRLADASSGHAHLPAAARPGGSEHVAL